jgi:hypothetical protein
VALSITFVHQVGAAILLVTLTLWLQHAGFTALMAWVRHTAATDIHKLGSFRSAGLVIKSALVILTLHGAADPVVGELVSLALLPVMGIRLVLLGSQLFERRLWRCSPLVGVAAVRAAGEPGRHDHGWRVG